MAAQSGSLQFLVPLVEVEEVTLSCVLVQSLRNLCYLVLTLYLGLPVFLNVCETNTKGLVNVEMEDSDMQPCLKPHLIISPAFLIFLMALKNMGRPGYEVINFLCDFVTLRRTPKLC